MHRTLFICVLAVFACNAYPVRARADVQPSEQMKQVMRAQAERAQRGDKSLSEFIDDLRGPAEAGDPVAQFMLGALLMRDDRDRAMKLFRSSAQKGCAGSAGALVLFLLDHNSADAERYLRQAIEGGDAASMMMVSSFHYRGDHGYKKSFSDALAWAQLAGARSRNLGLSLAAEKFAVKLQSEMDDQQKSKALVLLKNLEKRYPERAFYLCGQSTP
jgi:hypothetical protein